jgi:DNA-binding NtrC family response regulator
VATHDSKSTVTHDHDPERDLEGLADFRVLLVIASPSETHVAELRPERPLTVGRGDLVDLPIADRSLSRSHASFLRVGRTVRVTDLDSRNGTLVQGKRVKSATLRGGDTVVLGTVTASIQVLASAAAASLGLEDYGAVARQLEEEWARAQASRGAFSVALVRPLGKESASGYAPALVQRLGPPQRVGLYDRQSLLVLWPDVDGPSAAARAREWVALAASRARLVCGVATYPDAASTPDQLLSAVVEAGRRASARDPVVVAPQVPLVGQPSSAVAVRTSAKTTEIERVVRRLASGKIPVLVLGETGTGKELVARDLHALGNRSAGPLKIVNCAAIPANLVESVLFGYVKGAFTGADRAKAGVLEEAHGGTVVLDEVGELPAAAQAALLRALDSGCVCPVGGSAEVQLDVRMVALTHRDLNAMVAQGTFRLDLLHRLNAFTLELPPLRARPEEIGPLTACFIERHGPHYGGTVREVAPDALEVLERYRWPGNVRELRNVIERALALAEGDCITRADLPSYIARPAPPENDHDLRANVRHHEAVKIFDALEQTGGHRAKAARLLNIPLRTLERKLQRLAIQPSRDGDGDGS